MKTIYHVVIKESYSNDTVPGLRQKLFPKLDESDQIVLDNAKWAHLMYIYDKQCGIMQKSYENAQKANFTDFTRWH